MLYYSTIPSPIDKGNFDTFDTNDPDLNNGFLMNDTIETVESDNENIIVEYGFKTELITPKKEQFYLTAKIKNILKTYKVLISDVQSLVDSICKNTYENQDLPDFCDEIIKYKNKLKSMIIKDLLQTKNNLFFDSEIYGFGLIYSQDKIIGTFEGISINLSYDITLLYPLLNLDLENVKNPYFIFYNNKKYKYKIKSNSFSNNILKNCDVKYIDNDVPDNILELKSYNEFEDINEMFLDRNKLITQEKEEIYDEEIDFDFD